MYISTGSYLNSMWAMEDRCIDDAIMNSLVLLYFIKNKFHVAMGLWVWVKVMGLSVQITKEVKIWFKHW